MSSSEGVHIIDVCPACGAELEINKCLDEGCGLTWGFASDS